MRRSSSANALSVLDQSPRGASQWNPFGKSQSKRGSGGSSTPFHQTAMSIFSRISPKRKSPYLPHHENDDFLHNYMYCSKAPELSQDATQPDMGGPVPT